MSISHMLQLISLNGHRDITSSFISYQLISYIGGSLGLASGQNNFIKKLIHAVIK